MLFAWYCVVIKLNIKKASVIWVKYTCLPNNLDSKVTKQTILVVKYISLKSMLKGTKLETCETNLAWLTLVIYKGWCAHTHTHLHKI